MADLGVHDAPISVSTMRRDPHPGGLAPFVVGSGYGAWGAYEASTLTILRDYDTTHPLTAARIHDRVMNVPGLIASSSEPRVCP